MQVHSIIKYSEIKHTKKNLKHWLGPKESEFSKRGTPHAVMVYRRCKAKRVCVWGGGKQPERV